MVCVRVSESVRWKLKERAAARGTTTQELLCNFIDKWLEDDRKQQDAQQSKGANPRKRS